MTTDLDAAGKFYADVSGWELAPIEGGEMQYSIFKANDEDTAGAMARPPGVEAPPMWLSYIFVDDVDASADKAKQLGAEVHMGPMDDPQG